MKDTALVIIDVQVGMFGNPMMPPVYQGEALLEKLGQLIAGARAAQVPVIYVQHNGSGDNPLQPGTALWEIHPAIKPGPEELVVQKSHPDSFQETSLQAELQARDIKNLVIAGIQTEYCVDSTCRRAYSLGYDVTLVKDGHSTWDSTWDKDGLMATQIIDHHNRTLGGWFAKPKLASEICFSEQ
jgi:nicotinamidase-related amidase